MAFHSSWGHHCFVRATANDTLLKPSAMAQPMAIVTRRGRGQWNFVGTGAIIVLYEQRRMVIRCCFQLTSITSMTMMTTNEYRHRLRRRPTTLAANDNDESTRDDD